MIEGVVIRKINKINDERGFLMEILRSDWNDFSNDVLQSNVSLSKPGIIRAWHRHQRGQVDYIFVAEGSIKLCIFDEKKGEMDEIFCSGDEPMLVRVPGNLWHGYKVEGEKPALVIYFFNKHYDYKNPDEDRKAFDDSFAIPKSINGNLHDSRIGKPWKW